MDDMDDMDDMETCAKPPLIAWGCVVVCLWSRGRLHPLPVCLRIERDSPWLLALCPFSAVTRFMQVPPMSRRAEPCWVESFGVGFYVIASMCEEG